MAVVGEVENIYLVIVKYANSGHEQIARNSFIHAFFHKRRLNWKKVMVICQFAENWSKNE